MNTDNMNTMLLAANAVNDAATAGANGRAFMAIALANHLDLALVATVDKASHPFTLRDYAFKPMKDGKENKKLRTAQLHAIMCQGFGESETPSEVSSAVKTAFNETFPAALYMAANGGAMLVDDTGELPEGFEGFALADCAFDNVPLALAFDCFGGDSELTDTGKALIERVQAMFSPEKGPELSADAALDMLWTKRVDNVGGVTNRRYGLRNVTVTALLSAMGKQAQRDGLIENKKPRNGNAGKSASPTETVQAFDKFLTGIIGAKGESATALTSEAKQALAALQKRIGEAIKAAG